jgi:succinate dehydrogenase hydrophobic anchor subunit
MTPTPDVTFLITGIILTVVGILFLARADAVANVVAEKVQGVHPILAALFLVRQRPTNMSETAIYLSNIYRFTGIIATPLGLGFLYFAFTPSLPHGHA